MEKNIEISDKLIEQGKEFLNTTYIEKQVIRSGCADHTKMTANIFHLYPKKEIYRSDEYFFKNGEYKPVTFESPLVFEMWAFNTIEKTKYYLGEKQFTMLLSEGGKIQFFIDGSTMIYFDRIVEFHPFDDDVTILNIYK